MARRERVRAAIELRQPEPVAESVSVGSQCRTNAWARLPDIVGISAVPVGARSRLRGRFRMAEQ
jgi:hypothetical protein